MNLNHIMIRTIIYIYMSITVYPLELIKEKKGELERQKSIYYDL